MSITQAVLDKLKSLPLDKQQEVLDFTEFLYEKSRILAPPESPLAADSIWDLGSEPIELGLTDAAQKHDNYLYGSS